MVVAYIQTKEIAEGHIKKSFPILGILFVDFFNFYNSLELLRIEIIPKLPNEFSPRCTIIQKESFVSYIQIRGRFNQIP